RSEARLGPRRCRRGHAAPRRAGLSRRARAALPRVEAGQRVPSPPRGHAQGEETVMLPWLSHGPPLAPPSQGGENRGRALAKGRDEAATFPPLEKGGPGGVPRAGSVPWSSARISHRFLFAGGPYG